MRYEVQPPLFRPPRMIREPLDITYIAYDATGNFDICTVAVRIRGISLHMLIFSDNVYSIDLHDLKFISQDPLFRASL